MTVKGYLNFIYELKKCKLPRTAHINDVCNLTKITDVKDRIIKNLSKGYKQRVGLAQALIGNPPVLILDEPTVGLDPKQIIEIRTLIKKLGKNHTVILSSHILPEIQAVCDKIVIINKGTIVANDTADNLSKKVSNDHRLTVRIEGDKKEILDIIKSIDKVKYARADMEREPGVYEYEIEAEDGVDIRRELNRCLAEKSLPILMMRSADLTLEDIFLKITMGEGVNFKSKSDTEKEERRPEEILKNVEFGFDVSGVLAKHAKNEDEVAESAEGTQEKPEETDTNSSKGKNKKNGGKK
jgi:ABC-2 type transport system ATP-binding protein